ncbi:uncharacterized protein JCM6883_001805 [Sporobolomyces salmoneus]|uniref:uncharacterized protein n=1 Tax=Sporobolomyces salmoneus TaxID=183962 RepID=UPI003176DE41
MSDESRPRLSLVELRESSVLTVAGIRMQSHLKDYLPVAREIGAGVLVRDRWDTVSFVFKDEETSKVAYKSLESGHARSLVRPFAQWELYVAVRPVARVAFTMVEPIEELVEDQCRRIYVQDEYRAAASPLTPTTKPQTGVCTSPQHGRSFSRTSERDSVGSAASGDSYFVSPSSSAGSAVLEEEMAPIVNSGSSYRSTSPRPQFSHLPIHASPPSPSSWTPKIYPSGGTRQNSILRWLTFIGAVSTLYYLTSTPPDPDEAIVSDQTYDDSLWFFQRGPRATNEGTFTEYLDSHFPLNSQQYPPPHIWITLADESFMPGAENLDLFARQLNEERRGKFGKRVRETVVVTLCLDQGCIEVCKARGMYCYGGYEQRRPEQILKATWPKLASLIETLPHRDVFFVDADVSPRLDPYPHMEPLMLKYDLLATENRAFEHFNSGFIWMKRSQAMADAWNEVLRMDLESESRDQYRINQVLGTTEARLIPDFKDPNGLPLPNDFVAKNGLKVKVLDQRLFRLVHNTEMDPIYERHDSINYHSTCADDKWVKLYLAKSEGFWNDLDDYYSQPPRLISVDHLSASDAQITQLFKLVLAAAYYTDRAVVPPEYTTVTDLLNSPFVARRSLSTFPLSHLENAFGIKVLEPRYVHHATSHLLGRSVLNGIEERQDQKWKAVPKQEKARRVDTAIALTRVSDIDLRHHSSFASLVNRLRQPDLVRSSHIRFVAVDREETPSWTTWDFSTLPVSKLRTCEYLEDPWRCDEYCRGAQELKQGRVEGTWTSLKELAV